MSEGRTLNLDITVALNFGGIFSEFWEILGKYRRLDERCVGSKGLK